MKKLNHSLLVLFVGIAGLFFYPANAQQKGESNISRKGLLKIRYDDLGTSVVLQDTVIDLKFKDRPTDETYCTSFTVMLEVKNISKRPLYLPREITVYGDNAGFYDDYGMRHTQALLPGKLMRVSVSIFNTGHYDFHKEGTMRIFLEDSSFIRFPIATSVHFFESDSMNALRLQHHR